MRGARGERMSADRTADRVSIVVINFNGGAKLHACLRALRITAPDAELLVVDNASSDGSAQLPPELASHATVIRNEDNRGYAAAINQGAAASAGELLIFMNMDTLPEFGWLDPLVAELRGDATVGAANPLLLLADGERVNAAGQHVHPTALGFNRGLGCRPSQFGNTPFEVSGIQGAVVAMRRAVFDEVGGLDAAGFLYHEDVNLSWLLRLAGYRLVCVPASRVRHDYFLSMYPEKFHLLERNRVAMLLAYIRPATLLLLAPLLALTEVMAWGYATLRGVRFLAAKWRSYLWVARMRTHLAARRVLVRRIRRVGDLRILRSLRWQYDWSQFGILAGERGESRRKPGSSLPLEP